MYHSCFDITPLVGEIWKDIPGFENAYQVSSLGRIKILPRPFITGRKQNRITTLRIKKQYTPDIKGKDYLIFTLRKNKKLVNFKTHRLVAELFLPNPHNLEWVTNSENQKHAHRTGLFKQCNVIPPKGSSHHKTHLKESDVVKIRDSFKDGTGIKELAVSYGVTWSTMNLICKNKTWKHVK
jgi:hypothetical protein